MFRNENHRPADDAGRWLRNQADLPQGTPNAQKPNLTPPRKSTATT